MARHIRQVDLIVLMTTSFFKHLLLTTSKLKCERYIIIDSEDSSTLTLDRRYREGK